MAGEITFALRIRSNVRNIERELAAKGIDVSGSRLHHTVQLIGTSEEALGLGELASLGVIWAYNTDPTNYLEIRSATGSSNDIVKLLAGEQWAWRWGSDVTAPYAIANTSACYLEYMIWEI